MYHEISSEKAEGLFVISEESFSRQMTYLARHRYHVISLGEVVSALEKGTPFGPKRVVLTFDDGLENHFNIVYPALKRLGLTATFFVVVASIGKPGYMTWEEIRQLSTQGFTIGSHGLTHRKLPSLSLEESEKEIIFSKRILEKRLGREVGFFCYPGGFVNEAVREKVRQAGFRGACAIRPWNPFPPKDPYTLNRVWITPRADSPLIFWLKVSGFTS